MNRKTNLIVITALTVLLSAGCTSKQTKIQNKEKSATSDARISLTKKYTDCVSKAGADNAAIEACDAILDSIKKLE